MNEPDAWAPRPIHETEVKTGINVTGFFLPAYNDDQPVFLTIPGCDDYFLPLFSTQELFRAAMDARLIDYDKVKVIQDHSEFLDSIPRQLSDGTRVRVILDLRPHTDPDKRAKGHVRFTEIQRS